MQNTGNIHFERQGSNLEETNLKELLLSRHGAEGGIVVA